MTRRDYFDIIHKKTASLIAVSASAGAMAAGASQERVALMHRFGEAVGMAFQIQDDILDYTRTAHTGKPANNDLREGKITLPLLAVLERTDGDRRRELLAKLASCGRDEAAVEYLQRIVENGGGLTAAAEVMRGYLAKATDMLAGYEACPARSALADLCLYIAERDR